MKYWRPYLDPNADLPQIGDPRGADCILVQALGRNGILDGNLHAIGDSARTLGDRSMLWWLRTIRFDAGRPNRELAEVTLRYLARHPRLTAIVQWECAAAMAMEEYVFFEERIACIWPPSGQRPRFSTWDVKIASARLMRERGLSRPIELAHRRQIGRAAFVVKKILGEMPIIPPLADRPASFDAGSIQPWTRDESSFLAYERKARVHHLLLRYVW